MPDTEPILGEVLIRYRGADDVVLDPEVGRINRIHQQIVWRLVNESADASVAFSQPGPDTPGGIFFPWPIDPATPPPPGGGEYSRWPGLPPTGDATVYTGDADSPVEGDKSVFYLYYIALDTKDGQIIIKKGKHPITLDLIDPPIDNQPEP